MFGNVVLGLPRHSFEAQLEALKAARGASEDTDLTAADLRQLVAAYKGVYRAAGTEFPQDPSAQLRAAIFAVFDSWQSDRAKKYRAVQAITGLKGTGGLGCWAGASACVQCAPPPPTHSRAPPSTAPPPHTLHNEQAMVFGNMGETSGTGVCFSRNPATGEALLFGEYLVNAQGEDVVAGIRTPSPISTMADALPSAYHELLRNCQILERHYNDMQASARGAGGVGACNPGEVARVWMRRAAAPGRTACATLASCRRRAAAAHRAGRGIHSPGGHAVHAAVPQRQAHGGGCC